MTEGPLVLYCASFEVRPITYSYGIPFCSRHEGAPKDATSTDDPIDTTLASHYRAATFSRFRLLALITRPETIRIAPMISVRWSRV